MQPLQDYWQRAIQQAAAAADSFVEPLFDSLSGSPVRVIRPILA
jgi:hypothetical protein